jgi:hypothetical protein
VVSLMPGALVRTELRNNSCFSFQKSTPQLLLQQHSEPDRLSPKL